MSTFFIAWAALCVGFKRNAEAYPEAPSVEVQAVSPQDMARMGEALTNAGAMLESGDFAYLSGGIMVRDLGHGVVSISGDLSLRAVEDE